MKEKNLVIAFITVLGLLIVALLYLFIFNGEKVETLPEIEEKPLVQNKESGLYEEDIHVHEENENTFAMDEKKTTYSLSNLVFGNSKKAGKIADTSAAGRLLGGTREIALVASHPNYLYKYDYKKNEPVWITIAATIGFASENSDLTLYFEYKDVTEGLDGGQRLLVFNNRNNARELYGELSPGYEVLQGAIVGNYAYYIVTNDNSQTKKAYVASISKDGVGQKALQQQLNDYKIDFLKQSNGETYFASNELKTIYKLDVASEKLSELAVFDGEKILELTINGENTVIVVENESVPEVYANGELVDVNGYTKGYLYDEQHLIAVLYDGIYVYNIETGELEGLKKEVSDFYIVNNEIYYFQANEEMLYKLEILNK